MSLPSVQFPLMFIQAIFVSNLAILSVVLFLVFKLTKDSFKLNKHLIQECLRPNNLTVYDQRGPRNSVLPRVQHHTPSFRERTNFRNQQRTKFSRTFHHKQSYKHFRSAPDPAETFTRPLPGGRRF
jgi:hypothetical protein